MPDSPAFFKPIFFITKLEPMKALDDKASRKPNALSDKVIVSNKSLKIFKSYAKLINK